MIGSFSGIIVHQVGYQSSSENRKLIPSRVLESPEGAATVSQKRCRKRRVTRIIFPISSFLSASTFGGGKAGVKRTARSCPSDVCKTPRGRVTSSFPVANLQDSLPLWAVISAFPGVHFTESTIVSD